MKFSRPWLWCWLALLVVRVHAAPGALLINEILVNPPGTNDAHSEYIELRGTPNHTLAAGTYFLSVEGDTNSSPGVIQNIFDLSGRKLGQNGFLLLLPKNHRYKFNADATVLTNSGVEDGWGSGSGSSLRHKGEDDQTELENASCTFFLIQTDVPPAPDDDIDLNDDGLVDEPFLTNWAVLDSVGLLDNDSASDIAYGKINFRRDTDPGSNAVVTSGLIAPISLTPDYLGRNGNTTNATTADWVAGDDLEGVNPFWRLGSTGTSNTNTIPRARARALLNHLGGPNFGARALPSVRITQTAGLTKIKEGGPAGLYKMNLTATPASGGVTLRLDAPANLQISTDGGVTYGTTRTVRLTSISAKAVRVRSRQDTTVDISPRLGLITHTVIATADPVRYPLETIILDAIIQTMDNDTALLTEVKVNPPGLDDAPFEFVELKGPPLALLTNIYLVTVEGNGGGKPGFVGLVVNLGGQRFGTNGLLVIAGTNHPYTLPAGTALVTEPSFSQTGGALSNGSVSILLVGSPEAIVAGFDLDAGNNGILEGLPEGSAIIDAIGWTDGGNGDVVYGGADLTQHDFIPDAATRLRTNNTPRSAAAWIVGDLAGLEGDALLYDDYNVSTNFPVGTSLTIGTTNDTAPKTSLLLPLSGVIGDPDNPTVTFTVSDDLASASTLTVAARSTYQSVVPNANLSLTRLSRATWKLAITPTNIGYTDIILTIGNGTMAGRSILHYAASAMDRPDANWHTGISDASTAIPIDSSWMLVGDDENQTLRIFSRTRSGEAAKLFDLNPFLGLTDFYPDGTPREVDLEASTRVGNRLYWLGSQSHAYNGEERTNRSRIFATDLTPRGSNSLVKFIGRYDFLKTDLIDWDNNDGHGKGPAHYGLAASDADGVDPKALDGSGFNIEGLCMAPGSTTSAYLAFRAPLITPSNRVTALIVPVTNFTTLATRGGGPGGARFAAPIELNLGGRGIRSIEGNSGGYLIVAGPPGPATNMAPQDFRLFTWTGYATNTPVEQDTDLTGFNPEGIIALPAAPWKPTSQAQILSDNGINVYYGDDIAAKHLPERRFKKFRSDWVALGSPVAPGLVIRAVNLNNGQLSLTWDAIPGTTYRIEAKEEWPSTGWTPVPGDLTATSNVATKTIVLGSACQCFFRVKVMAAPSSPP